MIPRPFIYLCLAPFFLASPVWAVAKIVTGHDEEDKGFKLAPVLAPAKNDTATEGIFTIVDGEADPNGGDPTVLNDGSAPVDPDQPKANFFFRAGQNGGRIALDLKKTTAIKSVVTYSWHPGSRGPQVYKLYGSDGTDQDFNAAPKRDVDPLKCGWKAIAKVDTRSKKGGQHAVEISDNRKPVLGNFRYLLFEIEQTDPGDGNSNTFFSEIDVIADNSVAIERYEPVQKIIKTFPSKDGKFTYVIDSTAAPDLAKWSETELMPVVEEWYPKIIALLPSQGYTAPDRVILTFSPDKEMKGTPAWAAGNRLSLNTEWFRQQLENEARGCVVHELTHVVQNYWRANMTNPNPLPTPGWIGEGIPDYIRWFLYEVKSGGANIRTDNVAKVNYDNSYRVSANFLNWAIKTHGGTLLEELNTLAREGRYTEDFWKKKTGKDLEQLNLDWKKSL